MGFRSFVIHVANDLKLNQTELVLLPGKQVRRLLATVQGPPEMRFGLCTRLAKVRCSSRTRPRRLAQHRKQLNVRQNLDTVFATTLEDRPVMEVPV